MVEDDEELTRHLRQVLHEVVACATEQSPRFRKASLEMMAYSLERLQALLPRTADEAVMPCSELAALLLLHAHSMGDRGATPGKVSVAGGA